MDNNSTPKGSQDELLKGKFSWVVWIWFWIGFWGLWTVATTISVPLGIIAVLFFVGSIFDDGRLYLLDPISIAAFVGIGQGFILIIATKSIPMKTIDWALSSILWALATCLGGGITYIFFSLASDGDMFLLFYNVIFGIAVGIFQWLILLIIGFSFFRSIWWLIISPLGWGIVSFLVYIVAPNYVNDIIPLILVGTITGLVAGIITGAGMVWIVQRPKRMRIGGDG